MSYNIDMIHTLKKRLYFVASAYFTFWAKFILRKWKPTKILITGSSGKTTVLHLVEAQLGDKAIYSHNANSAFGISFFLLGLGSNVPSKSAWIKYFIKAPFGISRPAPSAKIFVIEADCDRPHEGKFTSNFIKPDVVLWVSVFRTHSMNFDSLVSSGQFKNHEDAIAHEFGYFVESANKMVLANADQPLIVNELKRVRPGVKIEQLSIKALTGYELEKDGTEFRFGSQTIKIKSLQPKELAVGLQMINELLKYLSGELDPNYSRLELPPGRSSLFKGKKDTVLIDSTYNTGLDATLALLGLFMSYPNQHKVVVLGDLLEQGSLEKEEHERLAAELSSLNLEQIVLLGKRNKQFTFPALSGKLKNTTLNSFESPKELLDYLQKSLRGGEAILFKGAQGLEGVVEQLLADPNDADQLVRREAAWVKRRQAWGLPK